MGRGVLLTLSAKGLIAFQEGEEGSDPTEGAGPSVTDAKDIPDLWPEQEQGGGRAYRMPSTSPV